MKVDAPIYSFDAPEEEAKRLESKGYAGAFTYEGNHDPFFPLALAAKATERIELYPAVAIGFARRVATRDPKGLNNSNPSYTRGKPFITCCSAR